MRLFRSQFVPNLLLGGLISFFMISGSATAATCASELIGNTSGGGSLPAVFKLAGHSEVYSEGAILASKVLVLSKNEYTSLVRKEQYDRETLLIVDELDLEVGLPPVAGVIALNPVNNLKTHIEYQAKRLRRPFLFWPGREQKELLFQFIKQTGYFYIDTRQSPQIQYFARYPEHLEQTIQESVLPRTFDRSAMAVVPMREFNLYDIAVLGGKFYDLARLSYDTTSSFLPQAYGVTTGYYEAFISKAIYRGSTLRQFIETARKKIANTHDDERIKGLLSSIREAIRQSHEPETVQNLTDKLFSIFRDPKTKLAFRTSNDPEDDISSGTYESTVADRIDPTSVEKAVKEAWASLYTYHAFTTRQAWTLQEDNVSMAFLVHPYMENEKYHGSGSFKYENGKITLTLGVVRNSTGGAAKATNPDKNSLHTQLEVTSADIRVLATNDPDWTAEESKGFRRLYRLLAAHVKDEIERRRYTPESVDIEFLIDQRNLPVILQYRVQMTYEVLLERLYGGLTRADAEAHFAITRDHTDLKTLVDSGILSPFGDYLENRRLTSYAILKIDGQIRLLLWDLDAHHIMRNKIFNISHKIQWLKGGRILKDQNGTLRFTKPGPTDFDPDFYREQMHDIFAEALKNEISHRPDLLLRHQQFEMIWDDNPIIIYANDLPIVISPQNEIEIQPRADRRGFRQMISDWFNI